MCRMVCDSSTGHCWQSWTQSTSSDTLCQRDTLSIMFYYAVGGIVQPATFVELRFCEFAPESRAFWGKKNCENGAARFEVIWVYFINALINLITPYIIWKTKTSQFICNSFHLSKVDRSFIGPIGTAESQKFLGAQHTSKEFSHKKTSFCDYWDFFICCWQHFGLYAQKVLSYP